MPPLLLAGPLGAAIAGSGSTALVGGAATAAAGTAVGTNEGSAAALRQQQMAAGQGRQDELRRQRLARQAQLEQQRLASGRTPAVPGSDPTDAFMRVLARQATDRQLAEGPGRAGAFAMPNAAGRYRLLGGAR